MNELSLFTGAGGGLLGTKLLGWNHIGYVENDEYCQRVIAQRIKDGILDEAPIFTDVREFLQSGAAREYRGFADVVTAGFPCQDISSSGHGAGIKGKESGLWKSAAGIISDVRPGYVWLENSPILTSRGLGVVLGDLAAMGYDAEWGVLGASDCAGDHHRKRIWILGYSNSNGLERQPETSNCAKAAINPLVGSALTGTHSSPAWDRFNEQAPTRMVGSPDELANRVDRLKAIGNGQIPRVAATAWRLLSDKQDQT